MTSNLYMSLIVNISLMVLIATILTKIPFMKHALSEEHASRLGDQLVLAVVFGLFCIFATCTGSKISGAIQNTRVLGALVGGLLGGPIVGMGAALIGAVHRFFYDPHGLTSLACTVSTVFEGVLGSVIWYICKKRNLKQNPVSLFFITVAAEICQMGFILLISKPFTSALALVKIIALPMILGNSLGMVLFFSIFKEVFTRQDLLAADKIRLALNIADQCIPYIQKTHRGQDDYEKIAHIIQKDTKSLGVLILAADGRTPLNHTELLLPTELIEKMVDGKSYCVVTQKTDPNYQKLGKYMAIAAEFTSGTETWSYLVLFIPWHVESIQTEINFAAGLAKFFSTNDEISEIEHQKKMREQAEFKALQSQINPHFLFNSLNTISYFCREKPDRARELLIALSVYFRHTLNSSNAYMITIDQELEHVRAYLMLEEARFEDRLKVTIDFPENAPFEVPTLILQPIVENAVKHGAMKRETGEVLIKGCLKQEELKITITDNGPGIKQEVITALREGSMAGKHGLTNVDARLRSIYGEAYALEFVTGKAGTKVIMRIPKE